MLNSKEKIDFVILWVDGNDKEWLKEKALYDDAPKLDANRYRDCDNLQYLFRGIEKYAPWVNNIFFITWGHVPKWLDISNPRLKVVNHKEFIPEKYLPTFNSNVIELNLHRIKELSEKFVLFNDDFFILKNTKQTDFFVNGLPKDTFIEYMQIPSEYNDKHFFMKANIISLLNKKFNKLGFYKNNLFKAINFRYGFQNIKTIHSSRYKKKFYGFWNLHAPQPYLKSKFVEIWNEYEEHLNIACHNKFRSSTDLGHYFIRYYQMLEGKFIPKKIESRYCRYGNDNRKLLSIIKRSKYKFICINDAYINIDFNKAIKEVNIVFEKKLNKKSKYEI